MHWHNKGHSRGDRSVHRERNHAAPWKDTRQSADDAGKGSLTGKENREGICLLICLHIARLPLLNVHARTWHFHCLCTYIAHS